MTRHLTILFFALTLWGCQGNSTIKEDKIANDDFDAPAIEFRIDLKLETLYFAFLLADYPVVTPYASSYKADAIKYFEKYREPQAILLLKTIMYQGFNFDYAVNWLYQHSDFPEFEKNKQVDFSFDDRPMNTDTLELFRKEFIHFYNDTRCDSFLEYKKPFLNKMTQNVANDFERKDIIQVIENYFGVKKNADYYVVLSPLLHSGGFAVESTDKNEMFALIGPSGMKDSIPIFDKEFLEYDMVIHEFSHNYVNPIVDEFISETKQFEQVLYTPIQEKVKNEGCDSWRTFMYELIVRTTTIRIVENIYGKKAADDLIDYEKSVGFGCVTQLTDVLKEYEKQRYKYPTLKDFFPEIITALERIENKTDANKK